MVAALLHDHRRHVQPAQQPASTRITVDHDPHGTRRPSTRSTMRLAVGAHGYEVNITLEAREGGDLVGHRRWQQRLPR
ncbi:MAG: hypothetical protein H0V32_00740 [Nocardioidaceae bacterium]|nr:hypothetical protein [Nocardioidaceae bacterium]